MSTTSKGILAVAMTALAAAAIAGCAVPNLTPQENEASGAEDSPAARLPPSNDKPADDTSAPGTSTPPASDPTTPPSNPMPGAKCDLTKPFGAPVLVAGLPTHQHFATPRLSSDERTIFFTTKVGTQSRIARAVRAAGATAFGAATVLDAQSSPSKDNDPSVRADGTMLFFSSERGGAKDKLYVAIAPAAGSPFGAPMMVSGVGSTDADEQHPYYRVAGGGELWFSSTRGGQWEIWTAKKSGTAFATPVRVEELRNAEATRQPMISEDGLTIVFASERAGGSGQRDLWMARRATTATPFGSPEALSTVNSASDEFAGWLSPDGCRLYFSSDRLAANTHNVYVASRP